MRRTINIEQVIKFLNSALETDPAAVTDLVEARVGCSQKLADHPTIQVEAALGGYWVGPLGVLNGLFGVDADGWGPIAADFDKYKIVRFRGVTKADKNPGGVT